MRESLVSKHLEQMNKSLRGKVSLGEIVHDMRHSGFGLIIIFLSLPFLQPIPTAGLSTALGGIIALLGIQMALHRESVWLPRFMADKKMSEKMGHQLLNGAAKFFKFIETFVRPRYQFLAKRESLLGILIAVSAVVLMLPIPIPFSNIVCAVPIVLMALALLEKDGLMAVLGIFGVLICLTFHIVIFAVGLEGAKLLYERALNWF